MINPINPLRHQHSLLLIHHSLGVLPHNIIQPSDHPQALRNLRMHGPVHVIQQIQSFADQLVPVLQITLLNLVLSSGVEIIRVSRPRIDVLDDGEDVQDILLVKYQFSFRIEMVVS